MTISPDTYAFLLESEYTQIRSWVHGKLPTEKLGTAKPFVLANKEIIFEWVWHNDANDKTGTSKKNQRSNRPTTAYLDFLEQYKQAEAELRKYNASGISAPTKHE